jgi:hypothetical protein
MNPLALAQLVRIRKANESAPGPFSADGKTIMCMETLSKAVTAISARLTEEQGYATFRFGDLRRTCETTLARLGVTKETRAWLLSHGRSGVQDKHYDRNTYLPEKRTTLELLAAHLMAIKRPKGKRSASVHAIR